MSGYLYRGRPGLEALNQAIMRERAGLGTIPRPPGGRKWGRGKAPHGTPAAARRHARHGEELCEPCRKAKNDYRKARRRRQRAARNAA